MKKCEQLKKKKKKLNHIISELPFRVKYTVNSKSLLHFILILLLWNISGINFVQIDNVTCPCKIHTVRWSDITFAFADWQKNKMSVSYQGSWQGNVGESVWVYCVYSQREYRTRNLWMKVEYEGNVPTVFAVDCLCPIVTNSMCSVTIIIVFSD